MAASTTAVVDVHKVPLTEEIEVAVWRVYKELEPSVRGCTNSAAYHRGEAAMFHAYGHALVCSSPIDAGATDSCRLSLR